MTRRDHNKKQIAIPDTIVWEHTQQEQDEIDPRDFLAGFWRKKWVFLLVFTMFVGAGAAYYKLHKPMYETTADIVVVSTQSPDNAAQDTDLPMMSDLQALTRSRSVNTQLAIVSSPDVIKEAYNNLGDDVVERGFNSKTAPDWSYKISAIPETDLIQITTRAYSPAVAARFANNIANTYFNRDLLQNTATTRKARQAAEAKMKAAEKELSEANDALAEFKQQNSFIAPDTQLNRMVERSADLSTSLDQAKAQRAADEQSAASIRNQLSAQGKTVETSRNVLRNPRLSAILDKIDALNSQRIDLMQEFVPDSPEVMKINAAIAEEEARLKKITETIVDSTTLARNPVRDTLTTTYASNLAALAASSARERAVQSEVDELQQAVQQLPQQERQYTDLAQKATIARATFEMLANKYRTLLLKEQTAMTKGMLISPAQIPTSPRYPEKKSVVMVFVLLGLVAGIAAALGADRMDQRAHTKHSIEKTLGLETLAVIPNLRKREPKTLSIDNENPALLERYRMLRNLINLAGGEVPPKIIAVTSPGLGDGKSTVALNLASAMGMENKRTLLVDADTRNPSLHKMLSTPNDIGLIDVLRGELASDEAAIPARIDNVSFLPAGKFAQDFPEMLNSTSGREAFNLMRMKYDIVILDCPASNALGDMQVTSSIADAVLLVVSMKHALKPLLKASISYLEQADANVVGAVINRAKCRTYEDKQIGLIYKQMSSAREAGSDENRARVRTR